MTYDEALRTFQKRVAEGNVRTIRMVTARDQYLPEDPRTYHYPDVVDDSPSATGPTSTAGAGPGPSTSSARTINVAGLSRDAPATREVPSPSGTRRSRAYVDGDARDVRNNGMASSPKRRRPLESAATWPQDSASQPGPSSSHRPNSQRSSNNGDRSDHRRTATLPSTPSTSDRTSARTAVPLPRPRRPIGSSRSGNVDHTTASSPIPITRQSTERILSPRRSSASDSTSSSPPTDVTQYGPDRFSSRSPSPAPSPVPSRHNRSQEEDNTVHSNPIQIQAGTGCSPPTNTQETEVEDEATFPALNQPSTPSQNSSQGSPPLPILPRQTRSFVTRAGNNPSALSSPSRGHPLRAHSSMPEPSRSRSEETSSSVVPPIRTLPPTDISSPASLSAPPSTGRNYSSTNRSTFTREFLRLPSTSTTTPSHVPLPLSPSSSMASNSSANSSPSTRRHRPPGTPFYPVLERSDREIPKITPDVTTVVTPLETRHTSPRESTSISVPPSTILPEPANIGSPSGAESPVRPNYKRPSTSLNTSPRKPTNISNPPSADAVEATSTSPHKPTSVSVPPSPGLHEPPSTSDPPVANNLNHTSIISPLPSPAPSTDLLSPVTPSLGLTSMVTGVTDALTPRLSRLGLSWGSFFSQPVHVPNAVIDPSEDPRSPMRKSASLPGYGGLR